MAELGRRPGYSRIGYADGRNAYQRVWTARHHRGRAGHQAVTAWIDKVAAFLVGHASQPDENLSSACMRHLHAPWGRQAHALGDVTAGQR